MYDQAHWRLVRCIIFAFVGSGIVEVYSFGGAFSIRESGFSIVEDILV